MHNIIFVLLRRIHTPLIALICVYAVSILGFVLIPGVDDQGNTWHMNFFHAFYFVSFMGTTIGFGEIPYAFTGAQRMWATISIYATVVVWLYAIGALLALVQDPAFRKLLRESIFRRSVGRLRDKFYLVCGYGDTGALLVRALSEFGIRAVVIEVEQDRINALELDDHNFFVPGLCADASESDALIMAGITNRYCAGVVALTNIDHVNLKIAITTKLLNPHVRTIARAETHDAEANIKSFGTDHIINPFDTFAGRLALALHAPGVYLLFEWMTSVPHEALKEPLFPPRGKWVLCGYGRFGKAVYRRLLAEGVEVSVIEADPESTGVPEGTVIGRGTEAVTLLEADIKNAVGVVAGTDDDANNLSVIITAKELNPDLFMVARQNSRGNDAIFQAAELDLIMQRGSIIAHKIFALITTPMLGEFLSLVGRQTDDWANLLVSRISGIAGDEAPHVWMLTIDDNDTPAITNAIRSGEEVLIKSFYRDPRNREDRLSVLVLFMQRNGQDTLIPDEDTHLQVGDKILLCGQYGMSGHIEWLSKNINVFNYIQTGEERAAGHVWKWLHR